MGLCVTACFFVQFMTEELKPLVKFYSDTDCLDSGYSRLADEHVIMVC